MVELMVGGKSGLLGTNRFISEGSSGKVSFIKRKMNIVRA